VNRGSAAGKNGRIHVDGPTAHDRGGQAGRHRRGRTRSPRSPLRRSGFNRDATETGTTAGRPRSKSKVWRKRRGSKRPLGTVHVRIGQANIRPPGVGRRIRELIKAILCLKHSRNRATLHYTSLTRMHLGTWTLSKVRSQLRARGGFFLNGSGVLRRRCSSFGVRWHQRARGVEAAANRCGVRTIPSPVRRCCSCRLAAGRHAAASQSRAAWAAGSPAKKAKPGRCRAHAQPAGVKDSVRMAADRQRPGPPGKAGSRMLGRPPRDDKRVIDRIIAVTGKGSDRVVYCSPGQECAHISRIGRRGL